MSSVRDELVELTRLLVDEPDEVEVIEVPRRRSTLFEVRVAWDDLGKVIGRQGRTARALRALLAARSEREGTRYELAIVED